MQNDNVKSKKIILTVDDFGYNHKANGLIFEAIEKGVVDQASTMVNVRGTDEAFLYIKRYQSFRAEREIPSKKLQTQMSKLKTNFSHPISNNLMKFGLHLNLTEGQPLSDPQKVPSLVDKNGNFIGWKKLVWRSVIGQLRSQDIEKETRTQIEELQTVIKPIPFLNSHHHIHLWPSIAKIIIPLCQEYGITQIRWPRKIWWRSVGTRHGLKSLTIQTLAALQFNYHSLAINHYFVDLGWSELPSGSVKTLLERLPNNLEVGCHPPTTLHWFLRNCA